MEDVDLNNTWGRNSFNIINVSFYPIMEIYSILWFPVMEIQSITLVPFNHNATHLVSLAPLLLILEIESKNDINSLFTLQFRESDS